MRRPPLTIALVVCLGVSASAQQNLAPSTSPGVRYAGFIYHLFGFATIRELELHQEAGFHPLEVIQQATRMSGGWSRKRSALDLKPRQPHERTVLGSRLSALSQSKKSRQR